jgi:hypothetical protein
MDYIINEHILKLTGKANLPQELNLGYNYKITIDGEITTITDSNNQDGTKDRIYKFEPVLAEVQKDNGEVIKLKDTRKKSVQLRNSIIRHWRETNSNIDQEDFYEKEMNKIINRFIEEH